ncbi:acyl-CoA thioesterase [Longimicrobium sp.]|uniref:acyl-CoA thioesterase n=1 Tax=Longimicrobium sp. TaxID=2029185 RepID=UPI002BC8BB48|nr:acyl-CoA thioesterase [Longimicrobium sp.]HSU17720.1 acyl-CoA thioesterase [Longimicrobium sp.]
MATSADAFETSVAILPGDVDDIGHVNNIVYLRWVQEAAIAHWTAVAPPHVQRAVGWVVLRHEIDYRRPALPGDAVRARTWVSLADAVRVERHTEIVRAGDGTLLARARTLWCPLATATGRPLRVSDELRVLFSVPEADGRTLKR